MDFGKAISRYYDRQVLDAMIYGVFGIYLYSPTGVKRISPLDFPKVGA